MNTHVHNPKNALMAEYLGFAGMSDKLAHLCFPKIPNTRGLISNKVELVHV